MQVHDFIKRLTADTSGRHRFFPPLEDEELVAWTSAFSTSALPEDYLGLLRTTNGIQFGVSRGSPNGYLRLLPLREIDYARQIMWGGLARDMRDDWVPLPHWLAISGDQDMDAFLALDPDSGRYYLMDACGADLTCPAGNNVRELLDYIWEHWIEALRRNG